MQKARSRLGGSAPTVADQPISEPKTVALKTAKEKESNHQRHERRVRLSFRPHLSHLPPLIFAIIGWVVVVYILTKIHPSTIKNLLIPNSYFLLLIVFLTTNFFTWSFILLNSRRGLVISLGLAAFLFLKLQQVIFEPFLIMGFSAVCLIALLINEFFIKHNKRS